MLGLLQGLYRQSDASSSSASYWTTGSSFFRGLAAGETVSDDSVLTLSAWYAALRNKSEDIGKLPIHTYRYVQEGQKERDTQHPVSILFSIAPNSYQTPIVFRSQMEHWVDGWGNAYAEIQRDANMNPIALHPIHPGRVNVSWDDNTQRVKYEVLQYSSVGNNRKPYTSYTIDQDNMFHLRGLGSDPLVGYSTIRYAAESLSLSLAAERFGASYFKNSGALSGIVKHPGAMDVVARNNFTSSFDEAYKGARRAGGWILLEDGMTYEQLSIPPEDAQFIQTRQLQIEEVARWLRIPLSKIMHLARATYNTLEMQNLEYVIDCLQPCAIRWEQEAKRKLFRSDEIDLYIAHNFNALLRGDSKAQAEVIRTYSNLGIYSVNESRNFLDMNYIGNEGNKRFIAGNMIELKEDMLFPADVKAQARAPREPDPNMNIPEPPAVNVTVNRVGLTQEQAYSMVIPTITHAQRKAELAIPRLEKKHANCADTLESKIAEFKVDLLAELVTNLSPIFQAFNVDADKFTQYAADAESYESVAQWLANEIRSNPNE
jgi:HK97 family phage portal protein